MAYTTLSTSYLNGDIFSAGDINNTNTVANALSNGTNQALIATKGDILTGSATANALAKTAVGSNNAVLYANSAATGGVSWGLVTSAMITDGTITGTDIASGTVTSSNILNGTIVSADIASNTITSANILNGTITGTDIASGTITSSNITDNTIVNADINSAANIADTKLATISTGGKVSNSATTATSSNTGSAIVARDGSGNFSTNAITANTYTGGTFNGTFNGNLSGGQVVATGSVYFLDYTDAGRFGGNTTSASVGILRVGNYTSGTTCITTNGNSATNYHMAFHYAGSNIGGISSGTSSTSFNTTSDYRLKENVAPLTNALNILEQVKPKSFNFIIEPDDVQHGFIAHELAEVLPYAVTGEKDAVDDEGNIRPQQVDYSKLTGLLVGAVQELSARVKELENN